MGATYAVILLNITSDAYFGSVISVSYANSCCNGTRLRLTKLEWFKFLYWNFKDMYWNSLRLESVYKEMRLITSMALVHALHPIKSRSRNNRWNLWVRWCVSSWRPWFWSVYSIYYIHTIHYSCNLSYQNKLFLKTYLPKVGVTMLGYRMIWYCYYFLPGFMCAFQLHSSVFFIS